MAKCKNCGAEIPEGAEYCEECLSKLNTAKDSESYLDSLLSAMMTEEPERREVVYPKKEASSLVSVSEDEVSEEPEALADDWMQDFFSMPEEEPSEPEELFPEEEEAPLDDAFGTFFDGEAELPDLKNYSIFEDVDESTVDRMLAEELKDEKDWEEESRETFSEDFGEMRLEKTSDTDVNDVFSEATSDAEAISFEAFPEEQEDAQEEVPLSEVGDIEDLFGMLEDERGADAPKQIEVNENPEVISATDLDAASDMFSGIVEAEEEPVTDFGDFADLFGEGEAAFMADESAVPEEEPVADFGDFADLFGGTEEPEISVAPETQPMEEPAEQPVNDFFDLFGSEGDGMFNFGAEPIELEEESAATEEAVPVPKAVSADAEDSAKGNTKKKKKKEKKQGSVSALYHKLFDNVKVDPSKIKKPPTKEELEAQKKAKQEAKEKDKEEKEALLAEKKEQERQVKLEKQRIKKEAKAEKKARKLEEAKLLLEEMETTRINRAGASIVFIFFAMIAVVIIVGTSIFSYSLSIRNAEYEFNRDEYTLAYNEIYGLDIKKEDIVLYDRIMTVMYVQKQLNSYYNYYGLNDQPKALDSLLKGLQRYEKYIELAVDLEVDGDLDSVRKKILMEINSTFALTEQEAMEIIQSDSQAEYSKKVYDAVDKME
ncbi:MAG: hypothetical protein J6J38_03525 [Lachnospiraceae bacterium]|nr:hypothetical protein [Lachnospiraceae bacterium]